MAGCTCEGDSTVLCDTCQAEAIADWYADQVGRDQFVVWDDPEDRGPVYEECDGGSMKDCPMCNPAYSELDGVEHLAPPSS